LKAKIQIPKKLIPLFLGDADVRASHGGRGSGKTRSFAKMSAVRGYQKAMAGESGIILCGRQFQNSLDDSSLGEVKAAIQEEQFLADFYEIGEKYIRSKDGRIDYSFAGLERNISSIKSKARILLAWIDEAEPVTDTAWQTLIPTIREEGSELWVTWNPARKSSPVESRFRYAEDPLIKCAEMNWRDNPWFPDKLDRERMRDLSMRPDSYDHIWEGGYVTAVTGAYFAKHLADARAQKRIGRVAPDPLIPIRLFMDIGGTGGKSDAFAIWAAQIIGKEIRVLNYYESVGQPIDAHIAWMHSQGYIANKASVWLPHDGSTQDRVYDVSYESAFTKAGYTVEVIPNQGKGAAMQRVEAVRRWLGSCWINEETCQGGIDALGWYHEKRDDNRDIGLGPYHDWSSNGADAFGLMCIAVEQLFDVAKKTQARIFSRRSWQG
jgi:phage terminase large subunit